MQIRGFCCFCSNFSSGYAFRGLECVFLVNSNEKISYHNILLKKKSKKSIKVPAAGFEPAIRGSTVHCPNQTRPRRATRCKINLF